MKLDSESMQNVKRLEDAILDRFTTLALCLEEASRTMRLGD